jgi:hypothetical protein
MMCALWLLLALPAQATESLMLERTIALHDVRGRIDHMAFDPGRKRLIVAELGNDSVDIVDVVAGKPVRRIGGLREPQGVGYAERADIILIANAGDGSVRLFNARTSRPWAMSHSATMPTIFGSIHAMGLRWLAMEAEDLR